MSRSPVTARSVGTPTSSMSPMSLTSTMASTSPMSLTSAPSPTSAMSLTSVVDELEHHADVVGEQLAIRAPAGSGHGDVTFAELDRWANAIAAELLALRGDGAEPVPLLICSPARMLAAQLGALKAGKFFIAINPFEPAARVAQLLGDLGAPLAICDRLGVQLVAEGTKALLVDELLVRRSGAARPRLAVDEERLAYVAYTSGSTGLPRGIAHSREHLAHNIARHALLGIGCLDCVTLISSDGFVSAISNSYLALMNGATLAPYSFRDSGVDGLLTWLAAKGVTVLYGFPSFLRQLAGVAEEGRSYPRLRLVYLGGESVLSSDLALARRLFPMAALSLGLNSTETGLVCAQVYPRRAVLPDPVPVGRPVVDVEVVLHGEPGVIEVRSAFTRPLLWRAAGSEELAKEISPGRFAFEMRDLGRGGADGQLFHAGRVEGLVKIRGFRVELAEVEAAIAAVEGVSEVAVVAAGAEAATELVAFAVTRRPELDARAIRSAVAEALPAAMIPAAVQVSGEALPRTRNGKVDRRALAARAGELLPAGCVQLLPISPGAGEAALADRDQLAERLVAIARAVTGAARVALDDNFFLLGGTSISALRMVSQLRAELGVPLPLGAVFDSPTVGALAEAVLKLRSAGAGGGGGASPTSREIRELMELQRPVRGMSIAERRRQLDRAERSFAGDAPSAPGAADEPALIDAGGVVAEWVIGRGGPQQPVVLFFHGGGYTVGSRRSHRHLAAAVGRAAGAAVLLVEYRLAPEHPFPAALDDALAAARWLRAQGSMPIVFAGDSAGGGIVMATLLRLRDAGEELPAAAVCLSPWVDLRCASSSYERLAARDPMLAPEELREMARGYLGGADARDPLASPVLADLRGLPPLLVQVGSEEILLEDARALAAAARRDGVDVTLEEWPDMVHVWHWFFPVLAEGQQAIEAIGEFARRSLAVAADTGPAPGAEVRRGPASLTQVAHVLGVSSDADRGLLSWAYQLNGRLNVAALAGAFDDVVQRHEILRTRFRRERGRWFQVVTPFCPGVLKVIDLSGQPKAEALDAAVAQIEATYRALSAPDDPRLIAFLYTIEPKTSVLALFVGDSLVDSDSGPLVAAELSRAYARRAGQPEDPSLPVAASASYLDYVTAHPLDGYAAQRARAHWERLARTTPPPSAWPLVAAAGREATVYSAFQVTPEDWADVSRSIQAMATTAYLFVLASFQIALARVVGLEHFLLHSTVSDRSDAATERMIGNFHSPVRIELRVEAGDRFRDVVQRTARAVRDAVTHCVVPPISEPVPAVRFHMFDFHEGPTFAGIRRRRFRLHSASRAPLRLNSIRGPNGRQDFALTSSTASQELLAELAHALRAVLAAAVADPDGAVAALDVRGEPR